MHDSNNEPVSWLKVNGLLDASKQERYVNALYWAFTTMTTVGYGDLHPASSIERIMVIVNMLLAAALFAYIINDIGQIVSNYNKLAD